jgi:hypothetical protein
MRAPHDAGNDDRQGAVARSVQRMQASGARRENDRGHAIRGARIDASKMAAGSRIGAARQPRRRPAPGAQVPLPDAGRPVGVPPTVTAPAGALHRVTFRNPPPPWGVPPGSMTAALRFTAQRHG